jgi:site-specific DNA recombinase
MTGACIYTRFSPRPKEKAEECDSIEKQRERCEAYCKANDYTVLAVYEEPEVSGGRADNRPQLQAALDQVCKEKATLVVYTLDRLARNVDDARAISKRLEKAGANLAILQLRVDTTTPYGKLFFTIVAAFAEFYQEDIAQRTSERADARGCGRER